MDYIESAKKVFDIEIEALRKTRDSIDEVFLDILEMITHCEGKVVLCGMGKSGHMARKIAATLSSLGTPSFFLHPAEALHGDLGMVAKEDVVILISHSGESDEIIRLIPSLKIIGAKLIGITSNGQSNLAHECDIVQVMPEMQEACALNLAPTASTTSVVAYGDALAVLASQKYGFSKNDFALFHPQGTLGKNILIKVKDIMAVGENLPVVNENCLISDALVEMSKKQLGVVTVVNEKEELVGIVTDGDLRRALEKKIDMYHDTTKMIMTYAPKVINEKILAVDALQRLKENSINNYPVIDAEKHVIGVLTWQMIVKAGVMV